MSDLGVARGAIRISTEDVFRAQRSVQAASQSMTQALRSIGIGVGAAQLLRLAVDADRVATAFDRQRVAGVNLAGSQGRLNELLEVYNRATGNAVDKVSALESVTKLMAVGFADNAKELDQFARAIRGISLALGTSEDTVTQNLILELFTQRGARLDQLGLQYDKVRQRADALQAADASLTQQQAYQNAVLEQAEERFGKLADSVEGQATGVEKARRVWRDLRLELAQDIKTNAVDDAGNAFSQLLERIQQARAALRQWSQEVEIRRASSPNTSALGLLLGGGLSSSQANFIISASARDAARHAAAGSSVSPGPRFNDDQVAALRRRDEGFTEIERASTQARLDETRSYERQRTEVIANYEKQIAREAQDFARARANAERQLNMGILDVAQDSARQRLKWAADLERNIAQARSDSAERQADARKDANKRLADLDEDFKRDQERRQKDFDDDQLSAAGRLDAIQLLELRKDRARQLEDAEAAHKEQRDEIKEQLQERLDAEARSLDKSIRQQQEANDRRLAEQAENDRLRIADMKQDFADRVAQEDIERGIMMDRRAEDHADQLASLAAAHSERIQQIKDDAAREREQFTEESNKVLEDAGVHNTAWLKEQRRINDGVLKLHEELLEQQRRALKTPLGHPSLADPYADRELPTFATGGAVSRTGLAQVHAGEFVLSKSMISMMGHGMTPPAVQAMMGGARNITLSGDIHLHGVTSSTPGDFAAMFRNELIKVLEEVAQ